MKIPLIEQAKLQARVLVPLIKALREEMGTERAHALVRKALGDMYRELGRESWQRQGSRSAEEKLARSWQAFGGADALKYDVLKKTPDAYEVNVTECQYAKFYKQLGEPELGFLLACSPDFPLVEGYGEVKLQRTQTIMQGASHCDFRYRLEQKKPER
jgi:hypothetical protein